MLFSISNAAQIEVMMVKASNKLEKLSALGAFEFNELSLLKAWASSPALSN
jgi:hypothetical protein